MDLKCKITVHTYIMKGVATRVSDPPYFEADPDPDPT